MKPEEALKYLKGFIDNEGLQIGAYNEEVLKTAIGALEKKVPKKPQEFRYETEYGYTRCECIFDACGNVIDEYEDEFCPNCGQAIDWDDE